jgi:RNA polymerase sigma factor (sigma-70 family)
MQRRRTKESAGPESPVRRVDLEARTVALFERWRAGDDEAVAALFEMHQDWLSDRVERELGTRLRTRVEPDDVIQEVGVRLLQYEPKPEDGSVDRFRALLRKVAQHIVTDLHRHHFQASKRGKGAERPINSDSRLNTDPPRSSVTSPSRLFERNEERALARIVVHFLPADRGDLIGLRAWFDVPFAVLSARFDADETALRMRLMRAMEKAAAVLAKLRRALPRLAPADRQVIRMRLDHDLTFTMMAEQLDVAPVAAGARFQQAMRRLGVLIDEPFRPLPDDWPRCLLAG